MPYRYTDEQVTEMSDQIVRAHQLGQDRTGQEKRGDDNAVEMVVLSRLLREGVVIVEVEAEGQVAQDVLGQLSLLSQHAHQSIELRSEILRTLGI